MVVWKICPREFPRVIRLSLGAAPLGKVWWPSGKSDDPREFPRANFSRQPLRTFHCLYQMQNQSVQCLERQPWPGSWPKYIPWLVLKTKQLFTMLPLGLTFVRRQRQRQVKLNIFGQETLIGVWLCSPGASHVWDIILCNHLVYNIGLLYEEFCKWFGYKGMVSLSRRF